MESLPHRPSRTPRYVLKGRCAERGGQDNRRIPTATPAGMWRRSCAPSHCHGCQGVGTGRRRRVKQICIQCPPLDSSRKLWPSATRRGDMSSLASMIPTQMAPSNAAEAFEQSMPPYLTLQGPWLRSRTAPRRRGQRVGAAMRTSAPARDGAGVLRHRTSVQSTTADRGARAHPQREGHCPYRHSRRPISYRSCCRHAGGMSLCQRKA